MSRGKKNKNTVLSQRRKTAGKLPDIAALAHDEPLDLNGGDAISQAFKTVWDNYFQRGCKAAKGMTVIYRVSLPEQEWDLIIRNGRLTINKVNSATKVNRVPDVTLTVSEDNFFKLVSGVLSLQMAFMTGKVKVEGNLQLATRFGSLFI